MSDPGKKAIIEEKDRRELFGFSVNSLAAVMIGILIFGIYVGILLFGENSLMVLKGLEREYESLHSEAAALRKSNQKLQKEYFELLQIAGDNEIAF